MTSLAILAGGKSNRMGQDKGLMPFQGRPLIQHVIERLAAGFEEVIISTNQKPGYEFLHLPIYTDLLPDCGALGGLFSSLSVAHGQIVGVVACDMLFANPSLFNYEIELMAESDFDVVIPCSPLGLEPLHAVYRRATCLPAILSALNACKLKLIGWLSEVSVKIVQPDEVVRYDPDRLAFWNVNTHDELTQAEKCVLLDHKAH